MKKKIHRSPLTAHQGFTLIELLTFAAIFAVMVVVLVGVLVTFTNIQSRESAQAEVNSQSQFVLQQIQYYVSRSSLVDIPQDSATSTLKLYLGVTAQDPTYIKLSGGTIYLQQTAAGVPVALTSPRVTISSLSFTRHANPPGHDAVNISFTMGYNSANPLQAFSEMLQTSVTRVSAATFDSNLVPSSTGLSVGVSGAMWNSVNQDIWFNGSNVGVGGSSFSPTAAFEVQTGNVRVDNGDVAVVSNADGVILKDSSNICWRIRVSVAGALTTASTTCP